MGSIAEQQDANILPPRRGKGLPIAVDSTARSYDLSALVFGDTAPAANGPQRFIFLSLAADGCKVYYHFRSDGGSADVSDTAGIIAAGGTAALVNTAGAPLPDGAQVPVYLNRGVDKFLVLKSPAGTTGTLWVWPSSQEIGG